MANLYGYELNVRFDRQQLSALLNDFRRAVAREKDKSLASRLEEELLHRDPAIERESLGRLAKWCKTDGIYQDGMEVARKISLLLFGCVLDRTRLGV